MSELWVPTFEPPQINDDTEKAMLARLDEEGVINVTNTALPVIKYDHEPFGQHLDKWGRELNSISEEGIWPLKALKMGAALALVAYREAGYYQVIDGTALKIGTFIAELHGVPDTFVASFNEDLRLQAVISAARKAAEFCWHDEGGGIEQVLGIGAGSARHYLQQAIAA